MATTAGNAARSDVASSATNVTIIAANPNRKGLIIYNDSTAVLKVRYGSAAASATDFTDSIANASRWTMPDPVYTGQIQGIWASANGNARITELT